MRTGKWVWKTMIDDVRESAKEVCPLVKADNVHARKQYEQLGLQVC